MRVGKPRRRAFDLHLIVDASGIPRAATLTGRLGTGALAVGRRAGLRLAA
jgi:hypothetical protein